MFGLIITWHGSVLFKKHSFCFNSKKCIIKKKCATFFFFFRLEEWTAPPIRIYIRKSNKFRFDRLWFSVILQRFEKLCGQRTVCCSYSSASLCTKVNIWDCRNVESKYSSPVGSNFMTLYVIRFNDTHTRTHIFLPEEKTINHETDIIWDEYRFQPSSNNTWKYKNIVLLLRKFYSPKKYLELISQAAHYLNYESRMSRSAIILIYR